MSHGGLGEIFELEPNLNQLLALFLFPSWSHLHRLGQLTGVLTEIEAGHLHFC